MQRTILQMLILISLLTALPATAQQPADLACEPPSMVQSISAQLAATSSIDELQGVQDKLNRAIAICQGWYFEGNTGDTPAEDHFSVGPVDLDAGVYVVKYEVKTMRYGELDIDFANLNATEYTDMVYEFRSDVDTFAGAKPIEVEGGRYTIEIEASNILSLVVYIVKP